MDHLILAGLLRTALLATQGKVSYALLLPDIIARSSLALLASLKKNPTFANQIPLEMVKNQVGVSAI